MSTKRFKYHASRTIFDLELIVGGELAGSRFRITVPFEPEMESGAECVVGAWRSCREIRGEVVGFCHDLDKSSPRGFVTDLQVSTLDHLATLAHLREVERIRREAQRLYPGGNSNSSSPPPDKDSTPDLSDPRASITS